jgi:hypothetical protein
LTIVGATSPGVGIRLSLEVLSGNPQVFVLVVRRRLEHPIIKGIIYQHLALTKTKLLCCA